MKKILLSVAVMATLALASCGSSVKQAEDKGAAIKAQIENCTDPDSLKMLVQQAQEYAEQLVKEGKDQAAAEYLNEVAPVVEAKSNKAASVFENLKNEADSVVAAGKAAADSVAAGVVDKANEVKDKATETVSNAAEATKEKAAEVVEKGADAAKNVADKAAYAASKAADAAKNAFKK
ncbi:MAG: hypothetical protein K2K55_07785 [Duncaniella sp.]|nr:hypothetical protein [Duncaniella sp.]